MIVLTATGDAFVILTLNGGAWKRQRRKVGIIQLSAQSVIGVCGQPDYLKRATHTGKPSKTSQWVCFTVPCKL